MRKFLVGTAVAGLLAWALAERCWRVAAEAELRQVRSRLDSICDAFSGWRLPSPHVYVPLSETVVDSKPPARPPLPAQDWPALDKDHWQEPAPWDRGGLFLPPGPPAVAAPGPGMGPFPEAGDAAVDDPERRAALDEAWGEGPDGKKVTRPKKAAVPKRADPDRAEPVAEGMGVGTPQTREDRLREANRKKSEETTIPRGMGAKAHHDQPRIRSM